MIEISRSLQPPLVQLSIGIAGLTMTEPRTKIIPVRLTLEEKKLWVSRAGEEGLSLSEWIRRRVNLGSLTQEGESPVTDPRGNGDTSDRPAPSSVSEPPRPDAQPSDTQARTLPARPFRTDFKTPKKR